MLLEEAATVPEAFTALRRSLFDLVIYAPLAGLTILGEAIRIQENTKLGTMATDGVTIWYSPDWVLKKGRRSITFDLLHEWLHIFGNHVGRRGTRDEEWWFYACDVRVAHDCLKILNASGQRWILDKDHIPALPWAEKLTVEEIYASLASSKQEKPKNLKSDLLPAPDVSIAKKNKFKQTFTEDLVRATTILETKESSLKEQLGNTLYERLVKLRRGNVPWDQLLQGRVVEALGKERSSWCPPNFRYMPHLVLPSARGTKEKELVLLVDISSSITPDLLDVFANNIAAAAARASNTTILTFDAELREMIRGRRPAEVLKQLKFATGSHSYTSTIPAFDFIDSMKQKPTAVVCLTDGLVRLPEKKQPVLWVIPEGGPTMSWGKTIHMQTSW